MVIDHINKWESDFMLLMTGGLCKEAGREG